MYKIRHSCFETNSSSMDRYDDHDDGYSLPKHSHCGQRITIELEFDDSNPDVYDKLTYKVNDDDLAELIAPSLFNYNYEYTRSYEFDDNCIYLDFDVYAKILRWTGGYAGDRYCPPQDPEPEYDESAFAPDATSTLPIINKVKEDILQYLHNHDMTECTAVLAVYGNDIDYEDLYDNIDW